MDKVRVLLLILRRDGTREYLSLLERHGVRTAVSSPCEGTAGKTILGLMGLEDTEKTLLLSVTTHDLADEMLREMVSRLGICLPGNGIAVSLPLSGIGGIAGLRYFLGDEKEVNKVEKAQETGYPYALVAVVARRGYSDSVMEAARSAGAGGGTIVHAKGSAKSGEARFLGISIAEEKEVILIVTRKETRDGVMCAIMERAGAETSAQAQVLSLPVDRVEGLRSVTDPDGV